MMSTPEEVAKRLFVAIGANDMAAVDGLYAPGFELWHSFDRQVRDRATCLAMIRQLGEVAARSYRLVESLSVGDRVAQRYELTLNSPGIWSNHRVDLVVFLTVSAGRIARMEEYLDSRDAAAALAAISAAVRVAG